MNNIIYGSMESTDVETVLKKIDKCLNLDDFSSLQSKGQNEWLEKDKLSRLQWANANYNLSIHYDNSYDLSFKSSIKRFVKKIIHKLIKFNLISICLQQTRYNAELVRIQNEQYELIGELKNEMKMLQKECDELRQELNSK